jgi:acetamidase/formamidase
MAHRTIHQHHFGWDRGREPVARIAPGERVELQVLEASGGRIRPDSGPEDIHSLDPDYANPVTGPVYLEGAEPGDLLVVELLDFELSGWGWTALIPGFGLLPDDFPDPYLLHSRHDARAVELAPGLRVPTRPFTGTIGVAPAEAGWHGPIPPRRVGGNLDIPDLVAGARLHLPVAVPGALLSVGDTHAAQGDGEVCGTAVESPMGVALRLDLVKGAAPPAPRIELPAERVRAQARGGMWVTTGVEADLMEAARSAVRNGIDLLAREQGLTPELAYCLCSVAGDLRISELVNAPNWVVSLYLPRDLFA